MARRLTMRGVVADIRLIGKTFPDNASNLSISELGALPKISNRAAQVLADPNLFTLAQFKAAEAELRLQPPFPYLFSRLLG